MFKQEETWKAKFESAPGRGKAKHVNDDNKTGQ